MNFTDAREYILERLRRELPVNLFYHDINHTLDVCDAIETICRDESVDGEELTLIRTAGLLHDVGFIEQYRDNEAIAARIAGEVLPAFGYSGAHIEVIRSLILATRVPQQPKTRLETIICDADLDYLGRDDFFAIADSLRKEWIAYGVVSTTEEFNRKQVEFFLNHRYFNESVKSKRDYAKQLHLDEIRKLLVPWS